MDHVADDEPMTVGQLTAYIDGGRCWVAVDRDLVGYILVEEIDGAAHIEQVSVLPEFQGRGIGRALIARAEGWAAAAGRPAVTLTTVDAVPWNRPLYEHLGFRVLAGHEIGAGLRARLRDEAAHGLDPALRVAMRRDLAPRR